MKRRTPCVPELHGQQTSSNSTARTTHIESSSQTRSSGQDRTIDILLTLLFPPCSCRLLLVHVLYSAICSTAFAMHKLHSGPKYARLFFYPHTQRTDVHCKAGIRRSNGSRRQGKFGGSSQTERTKAHSGAKQHSEAQNEEDSLNRWVTRARSQYRHTHH